MLLATLALSALFPAAHASPLQMPPLDLASRSESDRWTWAKTTQWFSFGASYATTAQNVTDGTNRPNTGTSTNGLNWVQWVTQTYAVNPDVKLWNSAWSGSIVDKALLTPNTADIPSIVDQVDQFEAWAGKNEGSWDPRTSICSFWIGINDVGFTYRWTNISLPDFYQLEHDSLRAQLQRLHDLGACSAFVLMDVPPLALAPLYLAQGSPVTEQVTEAVSIWNDALDASVATFQEDVGDAAWAGVFQTGPVFRAVIDNADALGYTDVTGFSPSYPLLWNKLQEKNNNTQLVEEGLLPQGSYFWADQLHPGWAFHSVLAHALGTFLGAVNVVW